MSRIEPDPVFAAAIQEELERRVRARRRPATGGAPHRWRVEFAAIAGVALLVGGIATGLTALHPVAETGRQGGSVTQPVAPSPTQDPTATAAPTPSSTAPPTASPPPTAAVPRSTPEPTERPTSAAEPTTAPTTAAPPASDPAPTGSSGLIGPTGAQRRSDAEIRSWAASVGNSTIWAEEAVLDVHCMADQGWLYDPVREYRGGSDGAGLTTAQAEAYRIAYYGPDTDQPYDWRTAGCHGRSVHLMGQDDAH